MMLESEKGEIEARDYLLKHYSSECVAHGAHILTWLIAIFTFVQAYDKIPFLTSANIITYVSNVIILSFFFTGLTYSTGRLFYWSYLTSQVVFAPIMGKSQAVEYLVELGKLSEEKVRKSMSINILSRLSCSVSDRIDKSGNRIVRFFGSSRGTHRLRNTIITLFIVWFAIFVLLAFVYLVALGIIKFTFN
jgi:hypothetical protein